MVHNHGIALRRVKVARLYHIAVERISGAFDREEFFFGQATAKTLGVSTVGFDVAEFLAGSRVV